MPTENGKIPNFTEHERFVTPKTDCALVFQQDKDVYQLGFQVCYNRVACHLKCNTLYDTLYDTQLQTVVYCDVPS